LIESHMPTTERLNQSAATLYLSVSRALGIWQYCDTGHDHGHSWQGSLAEPSMTLRRQL
jgi:hypothetical protein